MFKALSAPEASGSHGDAGLCLFGHCRTINASLLHRVVCLFTPNCPTCVLIAELNYPEYSVLCWCLNADFF